MAQPPVTLAEIRSELNLTEVDGHDDDQEIWGKVLAATEVVESMCGPVRPVVRVSRCKPYRTALVLPTQPVLSVTSVVDADANTVDLAGFDVDTAAGMVTAVAGCLSSRHYLVTYIAGRDPIPQDLIDAVLIVARLQWETQRGPSQTNRFTGTGSEGPSSGGLDWYRAKQLMADHLQVGVA